MSAITKSAIAALEKAAEQIEAINRAVAELYENQLPYAACKSCGTRVTKSQFVGMHSECPKCDAWLERVGPTAEDADDEFSVYQPERNADAEDADDFEGRRNEDGTFDHARNERGHFVKDADPYVTDGGHMPDERPRAGKFDGQRIEAIPRRKGGRLDGAPLKPRRKRHARLT